MKFQQKNSPDYQIGSLALPTLYSELKLIIFVIKEKLQRLFNHRIQFFILFLADCLPVVIEVKPRLLILRENEPFLPEESVQNHD